MAWINFRGTSSEAYANLRVLEISPLGKAQRRVQSISVPGRSGTVHIDEGAYDPLPVAVRMLVTGSTNVDAILAWLDGSGALITSDATDRQLNAWSYSELALTRMSPDACEISVVFECEPFKYAYPAATDIVLTEAGNVANPGTAASAPLLVVVGSGDISLTIGNQVIGLTDLDTGITLDCAAMLAYDGDTNMAAHMSGEFPRLLPGVNAVSWTGSVTSLTITPRWRYL